MNKRYWLRGGIILAILYCISFFIFISFSQNEDSVLTFHEDLPFIVQLLTSKILALFFWIAIFGVPVLVILAGHGDNATYLLLSGIPMLALYFALGAVLGSAYGNFRSRKGA